MAAGLLAAVMALLLFLELFEPWSTTLLWRQIFDFGHLPLFGVISILILGLVKLAGGSRLSIPGRYGATLALTALVAALSEAVQIGGPRDADFYDFLRDVVGALSFLLVHLSGDPVARQAVPAIPANYRRWTLLVAAVLISAVSAFPLARVSVAWVNRDLMFPTLFSFEHWWEQPFVHADNATATVVIQGSQGDSTTPNHALRVDFRAATYTGLILQDFYPDWRGYTQLSFRVHSRSAQTEQLRLRIDDTQAQNRREDRFERIIELPPGPTEITLPLAEIVHGLPSSRLLNLSRVKRIVLFSASQPRREFSMLFDDFALH